MHLGMLVVCAVAFGSLSYVYAANRLMMRDNPMFSRGKEIDYSKIVMLIQPMVIEGEVTSRICDYLCYRCWGTPGYLSYHAKCLEGECNPSVMKDCMVGQIKYGPEFRQRAIAYYKERAVSRKTVASGTTPGGQ